MRLFTTSFAILLMMFMTACVPQIVTSDVTRFHEADIASPVGKSFIISPTEDQEGSLEFKEYAAKISSQLQAHGLSENKDNKPDTDYAVSFQYGVDNGRAITSSVPIYGATGGGTTYHTGQINTYGNYGYPSYGSYSGTSYTPPTYGVVGSQTITTMNYTRYLTMDIVDVPRSSHGKLVKVFEGKVISSGSNSSFPSVSACLIQALFENFPGENGKTTSVNTLSSECSLDKQSN